MRLTDLIYNLPKDLIAQYPSQKRDECKLLVYDRASKEREHRRFSDLAGMLTERDVLVVNTTKVWKARLSGQRLSGGKIDILVLNAVQPGIYEILLQPSGRVKHNEQVILGNADHTVRGTILKEKKGIFLSIAQKDFESLQEKSAAEVPLPPYIKRPPDVDDEEWYQTVYAREEGSIAAPTAGFHFTEPLLARLKQKGVTIITLVLHIGYGTFQLISAPSVKEHSMLPEYCIMDCATADILNHCREQNKRIIAVGTSATRALESAFSPELRKIVPFSGFTELFISPGYRFNVVQSLLTNFHLPKTSLLALVYAFAGKEAVLSLYQEAIEKKYMFYSYGDAMYLI